MTPWQGDDCNYVHRLPMGCYCKSNWLVTLWCWFRHHPYTKEKATEADIWHESNHWLAITILGKIAAASSDRNKFLSDHNTHQLFFRALQPNIIYLSFHLILPDHRDEAKAVNIRYGPGSATVVELGHLTDRDLSTFSYITNSGDVPWFEVVPDKTYRVKYVFLYTFFKTDWWEFATLLIFC